MLVEALVAYHAQFENLLCGLLRIPLFLESEIIHVHIMIHFKEYMYFVCSHANAY